MPREETTEKKSKIPVNFRINPETADSFREASKAFQNQDAALNEMMDALIREKQRMEHPEFTGDIDAFQGYLKLLSAKFMEIFNAMTTAEDRAKVEVQQILDSKDRTIMDLQDKLGVEQKERDKYKQWFTDEMKKSNEFEEKYNAEFKVSEGLRAELNIQKENHDSVLKDKDRLNEILSRKVSEAENKLKEYVGLPEALIEKDKAIKELNDEIMGMKMNAREKELEVKTILVNKELEKEQALSLLKEKHLKDRENLMLGNEKKVQSLKQEYELKIQEREQKIEALRAKLDDYQRPS